MTEREQTILTVAELSLPSFIKSAAMRLQSRGYTLDFLSEVLAEVADHVITQLKENTDATS